jgi:hypothetical protein
VEDHFSLVVHRRGQHRSFSSVAVIPLMWIVSPARTAIEEPAVIFDAAAEGASIADAHGRDLHIVLRSARLTHRTNSTSQSPVRKNSSAFPIRLL